MMHPRLSFVLGFALALLAIPSLAHSQAMLADTGNAKVIRANALIRAGKYADAKAILTVYLATAKRDSDALVLLGVTDSFLRDPAGAVVAFDLAAAIPDRFRIVAAKAYADAAVAQMKVKENAKAVSLATKALALRQDVNGLFIRGTAYANQQKYASALADLEKAKAMAIAGRADSATRDALDAALVTSYLFSGVTGKGLALARELKKRSPKYTRLDEALAAYANQSAITALAAGRKDEAVADLEAGAGLATSRAVVLYVQAANVLSQGSPVDWKRVKAEVDKALAIDPDDARANYVAGIAVANAGDRATANTYLRRAKLHVGSDTQLSLDIDTALATLAK